MGLKQKDKAILRHEDALAQFLDLGGVKYTDIVDKINAFDWLDVGLADNAEQMAVVVMRFYESFNFKVPPAFQSIAVKAFAHKFNEAIIYLRDAIEETNASYNVEGTSRGFQNDTVNRFYYINYWADKKSIPVNYNDKNQKNRELFNLDTIILSILADKLHVFNEFERNKPKKR
jgi:hypothetical protein